MTDSKAKACFIQLHHRFMRRGRSFSSTRTDLWLIGLYVIVITYLLIKDPSLMMILGCVSIGFLSPWHVIKRMPILDRHLGAKLRFRHIVTLIITTIAVLHVLIAPADAIFLSGLEQFFINLAQQTAQAGGATNTLDANVVGLIFNLIRGVFLLLVAAAALFAYNQAQQGNDWRPIVTQVGLSFAIVIAIDVVTFIFIGNGTGATGG
jgi:hypothetical protein